MARPLHRLWRSASLLPLCEAQARPCHDVASVVRCESRPQHLCMFAENPSPPFVFSRPNLLDPDLISVRWG
uniref:Secreted protein n=1 Tax=Oryza barthii TaxID=65489 RepID=A0A0D3HLF0_9ORYZ